MFVMVRNPLLWESDGWFFFQDGDKKLEGFVCIFVAGGIVFWGARRRVFGGFFTGFLLVGRYEMEIQLNRTLPKKKTKGQGGQWHHAKNINNDKKLIIQYFFKI
jgi:hypothetical protein